ncbi:ABC transporter substrate-binding protein [Roseomonas terrae]|jgi:trehalose/maltose transport system substrate-binding protein|uniref:ABC transporter substrate-binding protein n=1 Tax=Neoroseomonas terrae TaxID=424799 RepID=A0ABS5EIL0_9PROT|nr:ABC transporter substrate-binding protein [Neoroseomonas terrae]MBR0650872.1 ABC transporter substrate-binding protein [Neoroseomonas terrae]
MRRIAALIAMLLPLAALPARAEVTLAVSCGSVGVEARLCREGAEAWARETGNRVTMVSTPASASERLALYQQLLAARSPDIDVLQIDAVWPGMLAAHLADLSDRLDQAARDAQFPAMIANNTVEGRLVGMPWFTAAGVLYYRRDLLEKYGRPVPESWADLAETARHIMAAERAAGDTRLWGFVFQARAYEGLTANALEWVNSHGGGTIVGEDGAVTIDNPRAAAAIGEAAGWIGTIAPQGVLNYAEEEARAVFQPGQAIFMRNWPYAWPLLNAPDSPVHGRVGVAVLPRGTGEGGRHSATLGGEQLAVSRYSRHPAEAAALVVYLTSREEQKRRAVEGGLNPTYRDLYEDRAVLDANPFFGPLLDTFRNAVPRPAAATGTRYNQVSAAFRNAVHNVLSRRAEPADALRLLEARLHRIGRDGQW